MCGELDESVAINGEIANRLTILARHVGVATDAVGAPGPLAADADRADYMERRFRAALEGALADVAGAAEDEKIDAVAAVAIALARAAGFLAGQLPPDADLFRATIEALTEGHAETRRISARLREGMQDHHHHDGEDHRHDGHAHDH